MTTKEFKLNRHCKNIKHNFMGFRNDFTIPFGSFQWI